VNKVPIGYNGDFVAKLPLPVDDHRPI